MNVNSIVTVRPPQHNTPREDSDSPVTENMISGGEGGLKVSKPMVLC